ncbi:MAG: hypothetical protein ACK5UP_16705 [Bacteroidota bacterium]|jgi:hypothetical protein|nr:hypothetical protein [Cytophagales bacterium]MCE2957643.1 hypothetical protein [Flammeovirgaceae bacterium]MCZ8070996.1 hypothetical protein [Cytophagales bacterium]
MKKEFFFLSVVFAINCNAQEFQQPQNQEIVKSITFYGIVPSFQSSQSSGLNQLLSGTGYPSIPNSQFFWGFGLTYTAKRFFVGADLSLNLQNRTNDSFSLKRQSNLTTLYFGYRVFEWGSSSLSPFVGIGLTDSRVILSRNTTSNTLNNFLTQGGNATDINHTQEVVIFGLSLDVNRIYKHESPLFGGFRAGYMWAPYAYEWQLPFGQLQNAPVDRLSHFFVQMRIGAMLNWNDWK